MEKNNKKQFAAAVGLLLLSTIPIQTARFYQTIQMQTVQKTAQTAEEIRSNLEHLHQISLQMEQQKRLQELEQTAAQNLIQEEAKRKPDDLNETYAKDIFDQLTAMDNSWLSNIYDSMQQGSFEKINFRVTDGDGTKISLYSNASEIMSLANVYAYYHDPDDAKGFLDYCQSLWQASHSYTLAVSEPYYCSGICISATPSNAELSATGSDAQISADCPGHIDLNIHMKIIGINGRNTLFELAADEMSDSWSGWNEQTIAEAHTLYEKDSGVVSSALP